MADIGIAPAPDPREQLAAGLLELAEAVRGPRFPLPQNGIRISIDANVWGHIDANGDEIEEYGSGYQVLPKASLKNLRSLVRGLGGRKKEKHYGAGGFTCKRDFGPLVSVTISAARETVCRKVPTGNKIVYAASWSPGYEEEEFKWECEETLLGAAYYKGGEE